MTEHNGHRGAATVGAGARVRRRSPWPLALVAALLSVMPFIFWYGTWFGRTLSDVELGKYLRDEENPRHEQHALSQLAERMARRDAGVRRWYPHVVALAASRHADVRMTAAWVMGHDAGAEEFHAALYKLLSDGEPVVRRNAALALVPFGDTRARPELAAMLRPYAFAAPLSGQLISVLNIGTPIKRESLLARVRVEGDRVVEIRAPLPGRIEQVAAGPGAQLVAGQPFVTLAPDEDSLVNALVGLRYVGAAEDLAEVERYAFARGPSVAAEVQKEAALTAEAIKRRAEQTSAPK